MKFGKRLLREMVAAWADHYVNYKRLKLIIHNEQQATASAFSLAALKDGHLQQQPPSPAAGGGGGEGAASYGAVQGTTSTPGRQEGDDAPLLAERFLEALNEEMGRAESYLQRLLAELEGRFAWAQRTVSQRTPMHTSAIASAFPSTPLQDNRRPSDLGDAGLFASLSASTDAKDQGRLASAAEAVRAKFFSWLEARATPADLSSAGAASRNTPLMKIVSTAIEDEIPRKEEAARLARRRAELVAWNAHAFHARHFAEINAEAARRIIKKVRKYRRKAAALCADELDTLQQAEKLFALSARIEEMASELAAVFEREMGEPLDPYHNMNIASKDLMWHVKWPFVILAFVLFALSFAIPVFSSPDTRKGFSLFVLVIALWVTEAIPYFCTAIMIPLVVVPMQIVKNPAAPHLAASTEMASKILLGNMFNDMQILVLGGLTIGKALSRANLETVVATWMQQSLGHRPSLYLLVLMLLSCLLCSVVSNVAAPLLVLGVIQKTLWEFRDASTAPQAILLGLAFACNLGGMLSPIASPQNVVGKNVISNITNVSFAKWVTVSSPLVLFNLFAAWAIILLLWKPFHGPNAEPFIPVILPSHSKTQRKSQLERGLVVVVSFVTVVLWCIPTEYTYGDTATIAIIPIFVFFGVGVLKKEDFNNLSWHLMFLLAGGNMLSVCARDSGLVNACADQLRSLIHGISPYAVVLVVLVFLMVVTTFISHTVAAMVMLPIIAEVGKLVLHQSGGASASGFAVSTETLVFLSILMCSGAMAFPVSSFPNINSLLAENSLGKPYLKAKDFLLVGTLVTLVVTVSIGTWMVPLCNAVI